MHVQRSAFHGSSATFNPLHRWLPVLCLLCLADNAIAQGIGIESVMRKLQTRIKYIGHSWPWPACCGSSGNGPEFPPDGFYVWSTSCEEETADEYYASLVNNMITAFFHDFDLGETEAHAWGSFYKPDSVSNLDGASEDVREFFLREDFWASSTPTADETNWEQYLGELSSYIDQLYYVDGGGGTQFEGGRVAGGCAAEIDPDCPVCPPELMSCGSAVGTAISHAECLWANDEAEDPWAGANDHIEMLEHVCATHNVDDTWVGDADHSSGRGRVTAHATSTGGGVVLIYLRVGGQQDGVSNIPPVTADGAYHAFASGAVPPGGEWRSALLANREPQFTISCEDFTNTDECAGCNPTSPSGSSYCNLTRGWILLNVIATLAVDFPETDGCNECSLDADVDSQKDSEPAEPGKADEGDCSDPEPEAGEANESAVDGDPVNLASGHKVESTVDLSVMVTGRDYALRRQYTSNPDYHSSGDPNQGLVGRGWSLNALRYVSYDGTNDILSVNAFPVDRRLTFIMNQGGTQWDAGGGSTRYAIKTTLVVDGDRWPVWRVIEPGRWEMDFYRELDEVNDPQGTEDPDAALVDLLLQERDVYADPWTYTYIIVGDAQPEARICTIYVNGTPNGGRPDAEIKFRWHLDESSPLNGMLDWVEARQPQDINLPMVVTEHVDYIYGDQVTDMSSDVGADDDLVQVIHKTRVDQAPEGVDPFWVRVTQYRYHDGTTTQSTDERLTVAGSSHQLKGVIQPEQMEFHAQKRAQQAGNIAPEDALLDAADALLTLSDGTELVWPGGDDPIVIDLFAKIVSYETSGDKRVATQYVQSACGCGGGATQGQKITYTYYAPTGWRVARLQEFLYDESSGEYESTPYRMTVYDHQLLGSESIPYLVNKVITEGDGTGGSDRKWVWRYEYGTDQRLVRAMNPSAKLTYTFATAGSAPTYSAKTDAGLVFAYDYTTDHRVKEVRIREGNDATLGNFDLVTRTTYGSGSGDTRKHLPDKIERFRVDENPGANDIEVTEFDYDFHGGSGDDIAWIKTQVEAELEAENGPGTPATYESIELFDDEGMNRWSVVADLTLTKREFDQYTGAVETVTRNADPADFDSDDYEDIDASIWGRFEDGGALTSTFVTDILGRVVQRTTPGGVSTYTVRELRTFAEEREDMLYYAELTLPHKFSTSSFNGPAAVTWYNAGRDAIRMSEFPVDGNEAYNPLELDYALLETTAYELSRRTTQHLLSGLVDTTREWHMIDTDWEDGRYETAFKYDSLGRIAWTENPNGTLTHNTDYDVLDRVLKVKVGTSDVPTSSDLATVAEYFYDSGHTTPEQGTGDGNLTWIRARTGDNGTLAADIRDTKQTFDFRNRLTQVVNPAAPHECIDYDNLDRVTGRALFKTLFTSMGDPLAQRGLYVTSEYSQRGLMYRQRVAIDPTDSTPEYLDTNYWFDEVGRAFAEWRPNSPGVKRAFDAHSRPIAVYVTNRGADASPGTTGNHDDAGTIDDDELLEQTTYTFDDEDRLELVTAYRRAHDEDDEDGPALPSEMVATFVAYFYDGADRRTRTANYGTNTDGFEIGSTAPTITTPPSSSDTILVTITTYDERGLVGTMTDPAGQVTKYIYDDLSRRSAIIENLEDASISWDGTEMRWEATGLEIAEPDKDRVTSFVYDGSGNVTKQVAHLPKSGGGEDVQITDYIYNYAAAQGSGTIGSPSDVADTLVVSNDLLHEVHYPDEDTGEAGTDAEFVVKYSYDAQGELRSLTDQNGTRHEYLRDLLGRVTADRVGAIVNLDIDDSILRLGLAYDTLGRASTATSYTNSSGTTTANEVEFMYTLLWQVQAIFQDNNGAVTRSGNTPTGDTQVVKYLYTDADVDTNSTGNYSRLTYMTYPDGRLLTHHYDAAGELSDRITRARALRIGTQVGQQLTTDSIICEYVGLGMSAVVDYVTPDVQLDRTVAHNGQRTSGEYPGWDRFGRVVRHAWVDGDLTTHTSDVTIPNQPPLVEETYTYDRDSNRLTRYDARPGEKPSSNHDFRFAYDGLDRLTEALRGINGATEFEGVNSQDWALDTLGNWTQLQTDKTGDGDYGDADEDQTRTHDFANEIVDFDFDGSGSDVAKTDTYDAAGNMSRRWLSTTLSHDFTHDAWNRVVAVEITNTFPTTLPRGEYEYNALHWRTVRRFDHEPNGSLDEERLYYYDASWRLIEELHDEGIDDDIDRRAQNIWGLRYIDDLAYRRIDRNYDEDYADSTDSHAFFLTDIQFSVVAAIKPNGDLLERVTYLSYGEGTHRWVADLNDDGALNSSDGSIMTTLKNRNGGTGTTIDEVEYEVEADLDRDGDIDSTDQSIMQAIGTKSALSPSWAISDPDGSDCPAGFGGYVFNREGGLYLSRHRDFDPALGRWLKRDPIGFVRTSNLFEYVASAPLRFSDASGLEPEIWTFTGINNCKYDYISRPLGLLNAHWTRSWRTSKWDDRYSIISLNSEVLLDAEAEQIAGMSYTIGQPLEHKFCPKNQDESPTSVRMIMVAPKTNTRPDYDTCCCNVDITVFWSPHDNVTNQSPANSRESEQYWRQWTSDVRTVDTKYATGRDDPTKISQFFSGAPIVGEYLGGTCSNHALWPYLRPLPIMDYDPLAAMMGGSGYTRSDRSTLGLTGEYEMARDAGFDEIIMCHSQGCNIAMSFINKACGGTGAATP